jgi:predicted phosphohydrolase
MDFRPPSLLEQFLAKPCLFLSRRLYAAYQSTLSPPKTPSTPLTIVCISDTHNRTPALPPGDVLVHAGDLSCSGTAGEIQAQLDWLAAQPHPHKVVIAGNHDILLDPARDAGPREASQRQHLNWHGMTYLEDSYAELQFPARTLRVFGSPRTPRHGNWAFQHARTAAEATWTAVAVPNALDVLVTHGPPLAHIDQAGIGCPGLLGVLWRAQPKLLVCGHVHAARGIETLAFDDVQARWEALVRAGGGFANLASLAWALVWSLSLGRLRSHHARAQTVVVNAAHMGGMRDELRRDAVVVVI